MNTIKGQNYLASLKKTQREWLGHAGNKMLFYLYTLASRLQVTKYHWRHTRIRHLRCNPGKQSTRIYTQLRRAVADRYPNRYKQWPHWPEPEVDYKE